MNCKYHLIFLLCSLLSTWSLGQTTVELAPATERIAYQPSIQNASVISLAPPNLVQLRAEDKAFSNSRFAAPIPTNLGFQDGEWIRLENGDRIWRIQINAKAALGLAILYDDFYLPVGSTLHMYDQNATEMVGAYTSANNNDRRKFLTGFIHAETVILEYFEPYQVQGQGRLHIFRVDYIYNQDNYEAGLRSSAVMDFGFGASDDCHSNVDCNADANVQMLKRAICRILLVVEEGTGFCTGGLINNVREVNMPYVLSAFHCQDGFTPLHDFWRFDFNYEGGTCANPSEEPSFESILGCTQRAGRQENDFLLLELNNGIPNTFNAFFLGWDRRTAVPQDALMVHHPRGDIKKIAQTSRPIFIFGGQINWNNAVTTPAQHHFEVDWTDGTFEVNSSGAPLIDQNNRVVGQLHGGNAACDNAQAWFGRLSLSWEGGGNSASRLKDWLDPDDTGAETSDGRESQNNTGITLSGIVLTDGGDPIPSTQIQILGVNNGLSLATTTDAQGQYSFSNIVAGETYQISATKTDEAGNGLSVLDLIQMRKHVLNIDLFQSPYQMLAADVNQSNSISTLDLIQTQKVILGININFDNVATWSFLAANTTFNDASNPFLGIASGGFTLSIPEASSDIDDFDIIGIKAGDVNNTADLN